MHTISSKICVQGTPLYNNKKINMKTLLKQSSMTTGKRFLYATFIIVAYAVASCKKDNNDMNAQSGVTEDDAVDVVTQSVDANSGGLSVQAESAATLSVNTGYLSACGVPKDSTISGSGTGTGPVSWSYNFNWHWMLSCTTNVPQQFDLTYRGRVNYDGPRITTNDTSSATLTVTGLGISSTQWTVNGNLTRTGTKTSKVGRQLTFTCTSTFTSNDIKVDKVTKKIVAGTVVVDISGTSSNGRSFHYTGTLTLNGSNAGRLILASGHAFDIHW